MFNQIFPDVRVLMVEPQEEKRDLLDEICARYTGRVLCETALLGSTDGEEVEFVQMETGSSVFEEASSFERIRIKKVLRTLDALVKDRSEFQRPDFIKLDVQGYELEVLKGATETLKHTGLVLLEVSLIPINRGAPDFLEVVQFMDGHNFTLLDFCSQIRRNDGALWQSDLLFVNKSSPLVPKAGLD